MLAAMRRASSQILRVLSSFPSLFRLQRWTELNHSSAGGWRGSGGLAMHGVMRALIARWVALIAMLGLLALVIATSHAPCVPYGMWHVRLFGGPGRWEATGRHQRGRAKTRFRVICITLSAVPKVHKEWASAGGTARRGPVWPEQPWPVHEAQASGHNTIVCISTSRRLRGTVGGRFRVRAPL
jgi:hypothetical protein